MFKGVNSPVITILKDDGSIDYGNMERHINHLIEAGLNGLLFLGSLGEFYAGGDWCRTYRGSRDRSPR